MKKNFSSRADVENFNPLRTINFNSVYLEKKNLFILTKQQFFITLILSLNSAVNFTWDFFLSLYQIQEYCKLANLH